MDSQTPKFCPLVAKVGAPCYGDRCAWWNRIMGMCAITTGMDSIREVSNQLNALNIILEGKQDGQE